MQPKSQTGTINPVFAGYAANQLCEATDGIDRVFDNLLDIARGNDPTANGYDMLRATRILYDRGFGKVTRNRPQMPTPQSEKSGNHTNHSSDAAASNRPAAKLEQKLDDTLGPPQAPDKPNPSHPERSAAEACPERQSKGSRRTLPRSGSTSPATYPPRPATYPTSSARHSTTYLKSPTTEPSSPKYSPTYTNPTPKTPPSGPATASQPAS